jgi:1-aminocyclopropane-1-carboxylate deaminase
MFDTSKSSLQKITSLPFDNNAKVWIKRDDLIDQHVAGNKWRKLKYFILKAQKAKNETLVSFGGAYSNHLVALAKTGNLSGFKTIGIVRGDELHPKANQHLKICTDWGMELKFISREEYALKEDSAFLNQIHEQHANSMIIPEGGAGYYGMLGCQEIWNDLKEQPVDALFLAAGTGTTTAGILLGAPERTNIFCVPVLAGNFMHENIRQLLYQALFDWEAVEQKLRQLVILDGYHFGKYGKTTPDLLQFIETMRIQLQLPLDKIYTGKAFYAMVDMINDKKTNPNAIHLFLHTGGL